MKEDKLVKDVLNAAIEVHRALGPGLLESSYEQCLAHELRLREINFKIQHPLPLQYKDVKLDCGYRIDILVEDRLILELKSVEELNKLHTAQVLTYMKLSNISQGLLMNFNSKLLKDGLKSFVL